ncbi:MAG: hypothetical protein K2O04_06805 [Clostridiales bacterium]|nr:hypothetical protein [Clostridiales bacterium]
MTKYISTRDASATVDSATAVLDGFAPDGGLYVPESLPALNYADLLDLDYASRVDTVLRAFFDFDVGGVAEDACATFEGDDIIPTVKIDDNAFICELWHGMTYTSKDVSLSVLSRLIEKARAEKKIDGRLLIPIATNGDLGKAAAEAFRHAGRADVCVFYSTRGMDDITKLELCATNAKNVCVVGVDGSFDDIQAAVKSAFEGHGLNAALGENNIKLTSANSVNIGVVVPQIACFYSAYCDLINSEEIRSGEQVDFVVPTGNFGAMLAGYYAAKMGLPINRLVLAATNNMALTDFIASGEYDVSRISERPSAPVLGNLERLIFGISGDCALTAKRMDALKTDGRFSVTEDEMDALRTLFAGDAMDSEEVAGVISYLFDEYGYLADAHTAAAYAVADVREFIHPTVVMSLASPYRAARAVMTALGEKCPKDNGELLRRMEMATALDVPEGLIDSLTAERVHSTIISPQEIIGFLTEKYGKKQ